MFTLYSALLAIGLLFYLPRLLFSKNYAETFRQRLGRVEPLSAGEGRVVWLHCVSVGEAQAARPLVAALKENFPACRIVVSTTTLTGNALAREIYSGAAERVFFFPLDFRFSVRRALSAIRPDIVLLMETEIWFNFIREAAKQGARVAIVNGRLSEKSGSRYAFIRKTIKRVLHYVDLALMQGAPDGKRLAGLGIRNTKIKITGNLKFDQEFDDGEIEELTTEFRSRFQISPDAPLIIAASTHDPEEKIILAAFRSVYKSGAEKLPRLMLVPRHPERFEEVAQQIKESGFDWARRSENPSPRDASAEIILLDSIGELRAAYPLAEVVFVGGSLIPHGGQNVLEPAAARKAIITGFYTANFKEIVAELIVKDAIIQLAETPLDSAHTGLSHALANLLTNDERREKLAENAFRLFLSNRGATRKTIEHLKALIEAS
jgi:3-deoxy-D-manno-octulosonic-acid transferase